MVPDILRDPNQTLLATKQIQLTKYQELVNGYEILLNQCQQLDKKYLDEEKLSNKKRNQIIDETDKLKKAYKEAEKEEVKQKKQMHELKILSVNGSEELSSGSKKLEDLVTLLNTVKEDVEKNTKVVIHDIDELKKGISYYNTYLQCNVEYDVKTRVATFILLQDHKSDPTNQAWIKFKAHESLLHFQYLDMHPKGVMDEISITCFKERGDIQEFLLLFFKAAQSFMHNVH